MVSFNSLNSSGGVPQEVAALSSQQPSSPPSTHTHNTRLQARLNVNDIPAMNDPSIAQYLNEGLESGNDSSQDHTPRIGGNATLNQQPIDELMSSDSSDSSSESDSDSDYNDESDFISAEASLNRSVEDSDDEVDQMEKGHHTHSRTSSSSDSEPMDVDSDLIELSHSSGGNDVDASRAETSDVESSDGEDGQIVQIDLNELLGQLIRGSSPGLSLDKILDKDTFLESLDIVLQQGDISDEGKIAHDKAEKVWVDYKTFNSEQFDLILGLDRLSISELMGKIHVDSRLDGSEKRRLLSQCSKLNGLVQDFNKVDTQNKMIQQAGQAHGLSTDNLLRINAGQLAKGITLLHETQSALQSAGYSLDVADLEIAMKSGLQVHKSDKNSPITFQDVVGIDEAKGELEEVVAYLKNPQKFTELGARIPKGILLSGPPGTGKTLLAKAVAGEAGVPFLSVSGSAFVEEYVGVGAKRVRELFKQANAHDACILFIDELDAVGGKRGSRAESGGQEHDQTLNQLLTEMDGFSDRNGVIVMAATNRLDILDSALKRPGRFDRSIGISLPTVNGREAILRLHGQKKALARGVDFNAIARRTAGYSGADLENLMNEAALLAGRKHKTQIDQSDIEAAHDKSIMGLEVPSFHMSEKNRLNTAYHESGHAIVSYLLEEHDPVYKVTIMPRGFSLGATHYLPDEDDTSISFQKLKGQLASLMGGRVAEEMLLGKEGVTTGASNDLQRASSIARRMITEWGFSKVLGPVAFTSEDGLKAAVSAHTKELIDQEVKDVILDAEKTARDILEKNRDKLDSMAKALMDNETIDQSQIDVIMNTPAG